MNWQRVTRAKPCPICHKDSWCMIPPKQDVVLCMRVTSNHPYVLKGGDEGYFHQLVHHKVEPGTTQARYIPDLVINVGKLMNPWLEQTTESQFLTLSISLGVKPDALKQLDCAWAPEYRAWAFPMRDGYGNYTGIRLRANNGQKWAVKGSHQGVFLPRIESGRMALVCEGPTDTAAALSLGFWAVGRPSCSGGMADIITAFRRLGVSSAVIIADNDDVGARGADMLRQHLPIRSALLVLPAKDLREFVHSGGTRELLDSMIEQQVWTSK